MEELFIIKGKKTPHEKKSIKSHSQLNESHKLGSDLLSVKFMQNFAAIFPSRIVNSCTKYYYDLVSENIWMAIQTRQELKSQGQEANVKMLIPARKREIIIHVRGPTSPQTALPSI